MEARATEPRLKSEPAAYVAAHYKAGQMLRVAGKYKESEQALNKVSCVCVCMCVLCVRAPAMQGI